MLSSGQIHCNDNLTISTDNLSVVGSIDGPAVFDCNGVGRAFSVNAPNFFLSNVKIVNGIADAGGGLQIAVSSSVTIVNCSFWFNTATSDGAGGAALFIESTGIESNVTIENCYFEGNRGYLSPIATTPGGAVSILFATSYSRNSVVRLISNTFFRNSATLGSGALVSFRGDSVKTSIQIEQAYGHNNVAVRGAVYAVYYGGMVNSSTCTIRNSRFIDNEAYVGAGVQIWYNDGAFDSGLLVDSCLFKGNNVSIAGGGLMTYTHNTVSNMNISITNCDFIENSSDMDFGTVEQQVIRKNGAAVALIFSGPAGSAAIFINTCTFARNLAAGYGGALGVLLPSGGSYAECQLCVIEQGVYYPSNVSACGYPHMLQHCSQFPKYENAVNDLFIPYRQASLLDLRNVLFINNRADCTSCVGGALVSANGLTRMNNVSFVSNHATQQGGGVHITGTAALEFGDNVTFYHNTAATHTAFSITSLGSVSILGLVHVVASSPPNFTVGEGQFVAVALSGVGNVSIPGNYTLECPPGFKFQDSSIGIVPVFVDGWPNEMVTTSNTSSCMACGGNSYSLQGGNVTMFNSEAFPNNYSKIENTKCLDCPFGGNCLQGMDIVLARKDQWAARQLIQDGDKMSPALAFTRCPSGYCCLDSNGCVSQPNLQNAQVSPPCAVGRNPNVPLCGSCLDGFTQDLRGESCTPDDQCNDGKWIWAVMIAGAVLWVIVLLATSSPSVPKRLDTSWFIPSLLFFFQNISLLFVAGGSKPKPIVLLFTSISNLHLSGTSGSSSVDNWTRVCVIRGMTTEGAIAMQLVLPAIVAAMMLVIYIFVRFAPFVSDNSKQMQILSRFGPAGLKLVVLFYTSIASVSGALLHCVKVNGMDGVHVMFRAGGVSCYTSWQKALIAVFAILIVPFPVLLLGLQVWIRRRGMDGKVASAISSLEKPYKGNRWYWPSVVLLRRLFVALVFSFEEDPSVQSLWFVVLFGSYIILQLQASAYASSTGNIVETLSLIILALTSLFLVRTGSYSEAAVSVADDTVASNVTSNLEWVQTILFFCPMVIAALMIVLDWKEWVVSERMTRAWGIAENWISGRRVLGKDLEMSSVSVDDYK